MTAIKSNGKRKRTHTRSILVKHAASKTGVIRHGIGYLDALPEAQAACFAKALRDFSRAKASVTGVSQVSVTLRLWFSQTDVARFPMPPVPASAAGGLLKNLRRLVYETGAQRGLSLMSTNAQWGEFRRFLRHLVSAGGFPNMQFELGAYAELPNTKLRSARNADSTLMGERPIRLKTMDVEGDTYHTDVLVPMSIQESDQAYLDEYQRRLEDAVGTFRRCALYEFDQLKRQHAEGRQLIATTDFASIRKAIKLSRGTAQRAAVPRHYFSRNEAHPNLFGNLLSLVEHEMDGIPRSYIEDRGGTLKATGPSYWRHLNHYGKNDLLPYLGILSSTAMAPLVVLLILENPRFNVQSLLRATLEGGRGKPVLLSCAGEQHMIRMTVKKPRAGAERHSVLSPLSLDVISHVVLWTKKLRQRLEADGRLDESRSLWLAMSSVDFSIRSIVARRVAMAFRSGEHLRSFGVHANRTRTSTFVERHAELAPWQTTATLKALRVSQGVLEYLQNDGSVQQAARALGHRQLQTTIDNYIPPQIQQLVYERQMRRHQNLLIIAAVADRSYLLSATDFTSTAELHRFLSSLIPNSDQHDLAELITNACAAIGDVTRSTSRPDPPNRALLLNDPQRLAVAFLYSDHARSLAPSALDVRDSLTGTTPRMWRDLVTALRLPLPDSWHEIKKLAAAALDLANTYRSRVTFPAPV